MKHGFLFYFPPGPFCNGRMAPSHQEWIWLKFWLKFTIFVTYLSWFFLFLTLHLNFYCKILKFIITSKPNQLLTLFVKSSICTSFWRLYCWLWTNFTHWSGVSINDYLNKSMPAGIFPQLDKSQQLKSTFFESFDSLPNWVKMSLNKKQNLTPYLFNELYVCIFN